MRDEMKGKLTHRQPSLILCLVRPNTELSMHGVQITWTPLLIRAVADLVAR